jgi:DNA-binding GntR family transcriptional regulator
MSEDGWINIVKEGAAVTPRRSLADEAAENLREFILLGKLAPGTAIPERDLAQALGISRTPLREALRLLEIDGLVEYSGTRRPQVADPSIEELTLNIKVLSALEALAGETACVEATDTEIAEIQRLQQEMEDKSDTLEPLEFFQLDMKFHGAIVATSRNGPLIETHRQYNARLWRARFLSSRRTSRRDNTLAEHSQISRALSNRDLQGTSTALQEHLKSTITNIAGIQMDPSAAKSKD